MFLQLASVSSGKVTFQNDGGPHGSLPLAVKLRHNEGLAVCSSASILNSSTSPSVLLGRFHVHWLTPKS